MNVPLWIRYRRLLRALRGHDASPVIDFVIIGSAKCGTTSLHRYLNLHPDIFLPRGVGINDETGLFLESSDEHIKGLSNRAIRRNLGDEALLETILKGYRGERIVGEETTDYTKRPHRTVRFDFMKAHNPEMKFLFIVRDPIQKLFSQYRHFLRFHAKDTSPDLQREVLAHDYYRDGSAYFFQLGPYAEQFGREAIKVVLLEDLARVGSGALNDIFAFLGAPALEVEASLLEKHMVNDEIPDRGLSLDGIPTAIRDFIRRDAEQLQAFLGRDLGSTWPCLADL